MSNQGYYGQQPNYPQPAYGGYPQQGYNQGPPPMGYGPPPGQMQYNQPPPQQYYQQAPPPQRQSSEKGCFEACIATLCCCFVCEEGCECCADCFGCLEGCC